MTRAHRRPAATRLRPPRGTAGDRAADDHGYSVVEFVLILPLTVIAFLVVIQAVLVWLDTNVMQEAAHEGAAAARAYQAAPTDGTTTATDYLRQVAPTTLSGTQVDVTRTPTTVTVRVHAHVTSVLPGLRWHLDETSSGPIEGFVSPR